jgi:HlyD family secretion protein
MAKTNLLAPIRTGLTRLIDGPSTGVTVPEAAATDSPDRDVRTGMWVVFGFFVVFVGWAALARVDAAVTARGKIIVSGDRQQVQNKTGGVIKKVLVHEGDLVTKGQVLVELAGDESQASTESYTAQYISLKAQEARLIAEEIGAATFAEPAEFAKYTGADRALVDQAMQVQRRAMQARRQSLGAQLSVLAQQEAQSRETIRGTQERIDANQKQQKLTNDELSGVKSLNEKGYAPTTRVRSLESSLAGLEGDNGALRANIAQANATISESQMRAVTLRRQSDQDIVTELRDTQSKLSNILPMLGAAKTEFDRTQIRAPVTGKVMGLITTTEGAVLTPGEKVMDVVPEYAPLVIEAYVSPQDGDDIRAGQVAQIRFTSMHERDMPEMTGKVLDVSGDSFQDQKTGESFYKARVEVSRDSLAKIAQLRGRNDVVRPGLPVEVVVPTRKRTVLGYLFEPINETFSHSFHEH